MAKNKSMLPQIQLMLRVYPRGAKVHVLELGYSNAPLESGVEVSDTLIIPVREDMVRRRANVFATVAIPSATPTGVELMAWSSALRDDPKTPQDETWVRIDYKHASGRTVVDLVGKFDAVKGS